MSSSSISPPFFLGAFSGFFLPPSRPDMVVVFDVEVRQQSRRGRNPELGLCRRRCG